MKRRRNPSGLDSLYAMIAAGYRMPIARLVMIEGAMADGAILRAGPASEMDDGDGWFVLLKLTFPGEAVAEPWRPQLRRDGWRISVERGALESWHLTEFSVQLSRENEDVWAMGVDWIDPHPSPALPPGVRYGGDHQLFEATTPTGVDTLVSYAERQSGRTVPEHVISRLKRRRASGYRALLALPYDAERREHPRVSLQTSSTRGGSNDIDVWVSPP